LRSTYVVFHESIPRNMIFRKSLTFVFAGLILCLVSLMLPSCIHDPEGIELLDTVCFDPTITGILERECLECHNGTTEGFNVNDPASIMNLVTPYDPKGSELYQVLIDINSDDFMPPDRPLSKEERTLIEVWIAQGAMQNNCFK